MKATTNSDFTITNQVEKLKERLLSVAEMISIYFSEVLLDDTKLYFVNVIYNEEVLFKEEQFIAIKKIQKEYLEFNIQIFKERQLRDILTNFNSFALLHIYFGKVIYGSPPIPDTLKNIDAVEFLKISKANFQKEQLKIIDFIGDSNFVIKRESNAYTSFGLHQSIELSFRTLERFFGGKALIDHSLRAHIKFLETLIPNIRYIFKNDRVEEECLIEKLDGAYIAARYSVRFSIDKEELNIIFGIFQKLFYLTEYLFNWQFQTCISNINNSITKSEKISLGITDSTQRTLIDYLVNNYSIHSIYSISEAINGNSSNSQCVSWLDGHQVSLKHTLLIITNDQLDKNEKDFMNDINQYFQDQFKTYILLDDIINVFTKLDQGGSYLEYLLKSQNRLYSLDKKLFRFEDGGENFYPIQYYYKATDWSKRKDRAEYIISLMQDIEVKEDHTTHLFLTYQMIIQVCIGLLKLFWNFNPKVTDLSYLVNLINHFSYHTRVIFNQSNFKNPGILEGISNSPEYMINKLPYNYDYMDMDELFSACLEFMTQTNSIADSRLNDIRVNVFQIYVSAEKCFNKLNG